MVSTITKSLLTNNLQKNKNHRQKGQEHILAVIGEHVHVFMYQELFEQLSQTFYQIFHIIPNIASACLLVGQKEGYMIDFFF